MPANRVDFHVRQIPDGQFTSWLFADNRVGVKVAVKGPNGTFHLHEDDAPILCVGGGSGLAPLPSILEEAAWASVERPVTLLYGARTREDLYCVEEINTLAAVWPNTFRYVPVLSAEPMDSDWQGARRFVSDHVSAIEELPAYHAYLWRAAAHGGRSRNSLTERWALRAGHTC